MHGTPGSDHTRRRPHKLQQQFPYHHQRRVGYTICVPLSTRAYALRSGLPVDERPRVQHSPGSYKDRAARGPELDHRHGPSDRQQRALHVLGQTGQPRAKSNRRRLEGCRPRRRQAGAADGAARRRRVQPDQVAAHIPHLGRAHPARVLPTGRQGARAAASREYRLRPEAAHPAGEDAGGLHHRHRATALPVVEPSAERAAGPLHGAAGRQLGPLAGRDQPQPAAAQDRRERVRGRPRPRRPTAPS
ncbi:hypothetical protein ON010_g17618 [Phytophthora cinnamomi]|nr:hypothetical protein ON010_g17618 [Phytophthora cinnamomi]